MLFMNYFFKELDKVSADWRNESIIQLDGASYHKSDEIMSFFRAQNAPICISAPYSYQAAPAECWFAYFKNEDLNPERLPLGKR